MTDEVGFVACQWCGVGYSPSRGGHKCIRGLIERIKADLVPSLPKPPADAKPPPKPRTEVERDPGEEG